jgi:hypothetical protein
MSRKHGRWGFTEEAKQWASRARRRDETADLRRGLVDADQRAGLTELWLDRWPECRPIGHELRGCASDRWVRFHSLPESKRCADTEAEYAEMLHRHHAVIDELHAHTSSTGELIVITPAWSYNGQLEQRADELAATLPAEPWTDVLRERDGDDEYWTHLFTSRIDKDSSQMDRLLRLVADYVTSDVIITDVELSWLYHPYDGGADVIAGSSAHRDELRAAHSDWLPANPQGL